MTALDMSGHIDSVFQSVPATRSSIPAGSYVDGLWVPGTTVTTSHVVTLQPLSEAEIDQLQIGAERIQDYRKLYVNDGRTDYSLKPPDEWSFASVLGTFRAVSMDNRPWRNYCKIIVSRKDDSA